MDRVNVEGLGRTKDDLVMKTVREIFEAEDFQQVVLKSQTVRAKLERLGCFKSVGVLIDTSRAVGARPEDLEVTFNVKELKRVTGGVNTLVGNNEGSVVIGSNLPNAFGRGEKVQVEYQYGTKQSKGLNATFVKPFHNKANGVYAFQHFFVKIQSFSFNSFPIPKFPFPFFWNFLEFFGGFFFVI